MKILLAHLAKPQHSTQIERLAATTPDGVEVCPFSLLVPGAGGHLNWKELDNAWRHRHPALLRIYARLHAACSDCDALLLFSGANLHPDFLPFLPTFNVYCCFDDPESSVKLSRPAAAGFDAAFHGNIAAEVLYESFGCSPLAHLPLVTMPDVSAEDHEAILGTERTNDIVFCCGRTRWRQDRIDRLARAFPRARHHGSGSRGGWISNEGRIELYRTSRIGWNIHNSTGPINSRLFELPAYGVMQICDNRTGLGRIFDLGTEAVGFDTIPEAIDATRYYLAHEDERRRIAAAGFHRFWRDYHAKAIWQRIADQIATWRDQAPTRVAAPLPSEPGILTRSYRVGRWAAGEAVIRAARAVERAQRRRKRRVRPFATELDERFYLGERVPLGGREHLPLAWHPDPASVAPDRIGLRRRALAWAATSFIGDAASVRFIGEPEDGFVELARVQPGRRIDTEGTGHDLVVAIVDPSSDGWEDRVEQFPATARLVVAAPAIDDPAAPVAERLHRLLAARFKSCFLHHLPDPLSPWIEPLPRILPGVSVLVECRPE